MPSETEMVPNSSGYPPPACTPFLTALASRSRERLQGVISFHEDATPICGLAKSSSPIPTARSIPRAAVFSRPSVTSRERGFRSGASGMSGAYFRRRPSRARVVRAKTGSAVGRGQGQDQIAPLRAGVLEDLAGEGRRCGAGVGDQAETVLHARAGAGAGGVRRLLLAQG